MERKQGLSRSAPAKGRNSDKKLLSIRDLNGWVQKGNKDQMNRKGSRNVGLLTENVTEERLLFARQCELGRERYKFLVNHAYEKQKFIERQKQKEKSMKKGMASARKGIEKKSVVTEMPRRSITVRIPPVGTESPGPGEDVTDGSYSVPKIESIKSSRSTYRSDGHIKQFHTESEKTIHFPKAVHFNNEKQKAKDRNVYLSTSSGSVDAANQNDEETNAEADKVDTEKLPSVSKTLWKRGVSLHTRQHSARSQRSEKSSTFGLVPLTPAGTEQKGMPTSSSLKEPAMLSWAIKTREANLATRKYGRKFETSIGDPRYVALTNTLSHVEIDRSPADFREVLAKNEILRMHSKYEKSSNAKVMHAKFIAFLLEKELAVG